ncbi:MAG: hypothetical protein IPK60_10300 [Sandaracinaceae bacterium]|nr:hypothetical protein [Sandaracinaceae bacterium]
MKTWVILLFVGGLTNSCFAAHGAIDGAEPGCECDTVDTPVCGSDGVDYECAVAASCAGIASFSVGTCERPLVCATPAIPCLPPSSALYDYNGCEIGCWGFSPPYLGCGAPPEDLREGCPPNERREYGPNACSWECVPIEFCPDAMGCPDPLPNSVCNPDYDISQGCFGGCSCHLLEAREPTPSMSP